MPRYIAAYDTELMSQPTSPVKGCLEACGRIVAVHQRFQMPATFFIVGKVLAQAPEEFRRLLDDPLFEVASHTWSHCPLKDHPICGPLSEDKDLRDEIFRSREIILKHFPEQACLGLRPACAFVDGFAGDRQLLQWILEAGYEYTSSVAWGPDFTLPAPLNQASTYADDGFADLCEYPAHGWHDNALKSMSGPGYWDKPMRLLAFPPLFPEAIPPKPIATAEDEFKYNNKVFIDRAIREDLPYVSLIWHPWSLGLFDPKMEMLELTFRYVREQDLQPTTYGGLHAELKGTL